MCNGFVRILRHLPTVTRAVYSHEWGVKICAHLLGGKDAQSELLCFELSYLRNTGIICLRADNVMGFSMENRNPRHPAEFSGRLSK